MADMAILHEIDKCMKCRACQVACEKAQGLTRVPSYDGVPVVAWDDPLVVKEQLRTENPAPVFVRYSCWHCDNPPCASACKLGAIKVDDQAGATDPNNPTGPTLKGAGGVYVINNPSDPHCCDPLDPNCGSRCVRACRRGGYPKLRPENPTYSEAASMFKCRLCYNRPDGPLCVKTCPGGALTYDTRANIQTKLAAYAHTAGDGHVYWASNHYITPPTSDPFIEDHISPMVGSLSRISAGKSIALPTMALGGIYALYRRRMEISSEGE
jgi:Fe-S-cluster-containing dehydrogenase component